MRENRDQYNSEYGHFLRNTSYVIINIKVEKKHERYNEDATNAITNIVFAKTYSFNNICYRTNFTSLTLSEGQFTYSKAKTGEGALPLRKKVSFII